jgi:hypothetical protein
MFLCNLLDSKDDKNSRIVFSTYQTMMNAIENRNPAESKISPSTTERIFSAKAKLILALQDLRFAKEEANRAFATSQQGCFFFISRGGKKELIDA